MILKYMYCNVKVIFNPTIALKHSNLKHTTIVNNLTMGRAGSRVHPTSENMIRLRRSSSTLKLMPWEIRHQHTMKKFLKDKDSLKARGSDEVARKNKFSSPLEHTAIDIRISAHPEKLNNLILSSDKENVGSPQESCSSSVESVSQEEESPFTVPNKTIEGTCVHIRKTLLRQLSITKPQDPTNKQQMEVAEAMPLREKAFNSGEKLSMGTKVNSGQLYHYELISNEKKMQLSKQSDATLNKSLNYAKKYNLDEIFNYAFPCMKEPLRKRFL